MQIFYHQTHKGNLGEQAYEAIREAIISLRLEPGKMVFETELAKSLSMSRTPIREAFRMLLVEELIEVLPQRGARIELISARKVEETRLVRESLETCAFRQAAREWQAESERCRVVQKQLLQLLENQRASARDQDAARFLQHDEAFHTLILQQTGNQTLMTVVLSMRGHLNRLRYLMLKELEQMDGLVIEHEALLAAVTSNDEALTVRLLEHHLRKLNQELPKIAGKFSHYFKP